MSADAERGSPAIGDTSGLIAIVAIGLAVRAFAWSRTAVMFNDGPVFLAMAEAIGEGRWAEVLVHPYHPLYPALISLVALLPVELESAAVSVSIMGGLLSIAAVFLYVRDAFGREAAWLSAWVVALHPWAVDFSADVMSDGLYVGVYLVSFAAMAKAVDRPSVGAALGSGVASGMAYLARPEGAGLLIVGMLLLAARGWAEPALRGRIATACAAMVLGGALFIVPFVVLVGQHTGEFVLTQKKSIAHLVGTPSEEKARGDQWRSTLSADGRSASLPLPELAVRSDGLGAQRPSRNWTGFIEAVVRVCTTSLAVFRFELVPFALLGFWATRSKRRPWRNATLGFPIVLYSGLLVLLVWGAGYVGRRHALAPWLPVIGLAVLGWRQFCTVIADWGRRKGGGRWTQLRSPVVIVVALVVVLFVSWGPRDVRSRRIDRAPVRAAAEWLARNHPNSGPVAAQKLRTAYYANAAFVPLLSGNDGRLAEYLEWRRARWVVIDDTKLEDHRGLAEGIGRWLHPVHMESTDGRNILVLAVGAEPAS